jgi:hypothetical protein
MAIVSVQGIQYSEYLIWIPKILFEKKACRNKDNLYLLKASSIEE